MSKKSILIFVILLSVLLVIGCKKAEVKTAITTEPLDSADSFDIQSDPDADLGNETLSGLIEGTSEEDVFEEII